MKQLDEFVMVAPDLVPPDLVADLLAEYAHSADWKPYDKNKGAGAPVTAIPLTHPLIVRKSKRRKELADRVNAAVGRAFDAYHARHSRRDRGLNFLHVEKLVGLRLIRYETGHFMVNHTDKYPDMETGKTYWPAVTFTANLNEDFEGGELNLLDGEILFKGRPGEGIFFPANFLFPHAVERVRGGTRYALVGWFL